MLPTVVAHEVQHTLLDYLRTTFRLADKSLEAALFRFLSDPKTGMFQGPYLDLRLPFRAAQADWANASPLDFNPPFAPYLHQLRAFERLASRDRAPQNTVVTTGTGSGKTECFLYPILDHCRRARLRGETGIKAIILYPMNALASDQAERLAGLLQDPQLKGVSAGLYVGGQGSHGVADARHLVDDREILRRSPPDILLTNYRMLDFLLMRPEDSELWQQNHPRSLQYLVLDELHTYDGAQGSDVACLIRRLKARLQTPERFLCCVGTSATVGSGGGSSSADPAQLLSEFATKIFAESFTAECLVGEDRQSINETLTESSSIDRVPYPLPEGDGSHLDPRRYPNPGAFVRAQVPLWFTESPPRELASELRAHPFLRKLLSGIAGRGRRSGPRHWREVAAHIGQEDEEFSELSGERQWMVLSSFMALLAAASVLEVAPGEAASSKAGPPLLQLQVQLWTRELHGLLHRVGGDEPRFAWQDELRSEPEEHWLPMLFCRECGFAGWGAVKYEGEDHLRDAPGEVGNAFFTRSNRFRLVERVSSEQPTLGLDGQAQLLRTHLCPRCLTLRDEPSCPCSGPEPGAGLRIRLHPETGEQGKPQPIDRCPACSAEQGLGFLASRAATLSSVSVSQLFVSRYNDEPKLLAFTDSVQDASHRAGFFATRAFRFSLRTAIQAPLEQEDEGVRLSRLSAQVFEYWKEQKSEAAAAALLIPPDLNEDRAYLGYFESLAGEARGNASRPTAAQRRAMLELLQLRLSWEITREYGLAATLGRSLDATSCSTLSLPPKPLQAAAEELREHLQAHHVASFRRTLQGDDVQHFLLGLFQRLRHGGGIWHPLLESYARHGSRYFLSKLRNPRLSRFGPQMAAPQFWYTGKLPTQRNQAAYQPLHSTPTGRNWYRVWTARALDLRKENDASLNGMLDRAQRVLREHGLLTTRRGPNKESQVSGLDPTALWVTRRVRRVACDTCGHKLTLAEADAERCLGRPCLRFSCAHGKYQLDARTEEAERYYRELYRSGQVERVFAAEHTGLLEREAREQLEQAFKHATRPDAPNLLTCTPTLEMGIDIGDLSNVMLCSVPPLPANYVQRVGRAGRKSGTAVVLTVASRAPHDRYFFDQPEEMLRGEISPPGCFIDAPEVLSRQLLAFAMDCWARQLEKRSGAIIPPRMNLLRLNAEDAFPGQFWSYYQEHKHQLTEAFVKLFAGQLSSENVQRLRQLSAGGGMALAMRDAFASVKQQIKDYTKKLSEIRQRMDELKAHPELASERFDEESDEKVVDVETELQELVDAENAYLRLRSQLSHKYPLNVLSDAGIIPNYAFPEPGVTLSALLRDPFEEPSASRKPERVEYVRAASQAIREFAPFNTFYAEGHKIRVSQIDLGNKGAAIETWRLCANCHHMREEPDKPAEIEAVCPRCQHPQWSDVGQLQRLVRFRRAFSLIDRAASSTAEDSEERDRQSYKLMELIDVGPENYAGARWVQDHDLVFGYELLLNQRLREINFGRHHDVGLPTQRAGERVPQRGFLVCKLCGKVSEKESELQHTPICAVRRRNAKPQAEHVTLYREFRSEALRVLLPISQLEDRKLLYSMKAALFLGFRKKFQGHPDHLRITTLREPRAETVRYFLVIYDTVPGGTGYLAELWKTNGLLEVLEQALETMQSCSCNEDATKDGCYRCVFAYQQSYELPHISRTSAVKAVESILAAAHRLERIDTLSDADVSDLTESELERRFVAALQEQANAPGCEWVPTQHGGKPCHVLKTPNSEWLIEPQVDLDQVVGVAVASRPDFLLKCLSNPKQRSIAVFCDGAEFHVCPGKEQSRLGDDVRKRRAILESGNFLVWSITWKDLEAGPVTSLLTRAQQQMYFLFFPDRGAAGYRDHQEKLSQSAWHLLWAYLQQPNDELWERDAMELSASMLQVHSPWSTASIAEQHEGLRYQSRRVASELAVHDFNQGTPLWWAGREAREHAVLLTRVAAEAMGQKDWQRAELTLRLFDSTQDRQAEGFEASWRAFLHAWNILQFHPQGVEVTSTEFIHWTEGVEEANSVRLPAEPRSGAATSASAATPSLASSQSADEYEQFAKEYSDGQHLRELAQLLREHRLPLPTDASGEEFEDELEALLWWQEANLVLVAELHPRDEAAWRARGYRALDYDAPAVQLLEALREALR